MAPNADETPENADLWIVEATKQEFDEAVEHLGTTKCELPLSEEVQRRLFGLHTRVKRGIPPAAQEGSGADEKEKWQAWDETRGLSELDAMQEYIELVHKHDPSFTFAGGDGADAGSPGCKSLSNEEALKKQLAAAGILQRGDDGSGRIKDVFDAAASGKDLDLFLPAERDAVNEEGLTPLIIACDAEKDAAVVVLLAAKAAVDAVDPQGATALHYAALMGNETITKHLLAAGADVSVKDEDGATPAGAARSEGHKSLAEMIEAARKGSGGYR